LGGGTVADAIKPEAQHAMRVAIWLLFAVYCFPLLAITLAYMATGGFADTSLALSTFVGFTSMGDESLSLVHRALLPLMAGLAPIAFLDEKSTRSSTWLMVLLIAGIALSIFLSAVFHTQAVLDRLDEQSLFAVPDGADAAATQLAFQNGMNLVNSFFNRTQETLGMYLLMLFGLTLAKR
jgi:hypothetical protein